MSDAPGDLQTIDEIAALAEFEPEATLVFTEGRHDASLFQWFMDDLRLSGTAVAVGDRVFIPREQTEKYSTDHGERAKAVTLSSELEGLLGRGLRQFVVIVDADWTSVLGPQPINRDYLLVTDFPSIEHYALQDRPLKRFFSLALGQPESPSAADLYMVMGPALAVIAAVRVALHQYGIKGIANPADACTFSKNSISVTTSELVRRCLSKISKADREHSLEELTSQANSYIEMLGNLGQLGRGHDVAPVLVKYLGLKGHYAAPDVVESLLRTSLHPSELREWPLFSELEQRLRRT
ncbi:hypothetical protein BJG92_00503 [Arthrobacter sp. SO5]|uniref:hypothetical protein n=1 Tax=Arthrobacter sp. SO5 TaxID=1897055 RepID=UPI001E3611AB|nr:hypothetical protein [Arthrobacter sp. SO5]MCB5272991.1 hypothetical protein [Arthrobacter sp. SO5]